MKNSSGKKTIEHKGIVQKNNNESVNVLIISESACSGCHAEGLCSMANSKEKNVEVKGNFNVKEGDQVTVTLEQSAGYRALLLGYLIPLLLVLAILIIMISAGAGELVSGILAIASLLPYYLILYLLREKINEKFIFSIKA